MVCFEQFSLLCGLAIFASFASIGCAATDSGSCGGGLQGSGDSILMKNLSIALTKADGDSRLTFVLENTSTKNIKQCASGSICTSTGQTASIKFNVGLNICSGLGDKPGEYCADSALETMCQNGLMAGQSSEILAVSGLTYGTTLEEWEEPGTNYTLTLNFLMDDAEAVGTQSITTLK